MIKVAPARKESTIDLISDHWSGPLYLQDQGEVGVGVGVDILSLHLSIIPPSEAATVPVYWLEVPPGARSGQPSSQEMTEVSRLIEISPANLQHVESLLSLFIADFLSPQSLHRDTKYHPVCCLPVHHQASTKISLLSAAASHPGGHQVWTEGGIPDVDVSHLVAGG